MRTHACNSCKAHATNSPATHDPSPLILTPAAYVPTIVTYVVGETEVWSQAPPHLRSYAADIKRATCPRIKRDKEGTPDWTVAAVLDPETTTDMHPRIKLRTPRHKFNGTTLCRMLWQDWWLHVGQMYVHFHPTPDISKSQGPKGIQAISASLDQVLACASAVPTKIRVVDTTSDGYAVADWFRRVVDLAYGLDEYCGLSANPTLIRWPMHQLPPTPKTGFQPPSGQEASQGDLAWTHIGLQVPDHNLNRGLAGMCILDDYLPLWYPGGYTTYVNLP